MRDNLLRGLGGCRACQSEGRSPRAGGHPERSVRVPGEASAEAFRGHPGSVVAKAAAEDSEGVFRADDASPEGRSRIDGIQNQPEILAKGPASDEQKG